MTTIRDFQSPSRVGTGSSENAPLSPQSSRHPQSPVRVRTHRGSEARRESLISLSSTNTAGQRQRHVARSNTVKAYHEPDRPNYQPGAEPGIDAAAETVEPRLEAVHEHCDIDIIDYSDEHMLCVQTDNDNLKEALEEPRPDDMPCRWISVNGLSWDVIKVLGNKYNLHRLAIEDLLNTRSRTKVDWYSDHAFLILTLQKLVRIHSHDKHEECDCPHMPYEATDGSPNVYDDQPKRVKTWRKAFNSAKAHTSKDPVLPRYEETDPASKIDDLIKAHSSTDIESPIKPIRTLHRYEGTQNPEHTAFMERHSALAEEDLVVSVEQVAIFLLADNTVISFFEHSGADVEGPIIERLESPETMLRRSADASLLVQAIIDTIVDLGLPVKDAYNKARKDLQIDVLTNPDIETSKSLHIFVEEIDMLQNLFKPIVQLVNALRDHNSEPLAVKSVPSGVFSHRAQLNHTGTDSSTGGLNRKPLRRMQTSTSSVVITPLAHTYLGDVLDHCITMIQSLEQMDASANNLSDLIFNTVGANTNNFMMILALVTVFFSPLTFISGYFGMNFVRFDSVNEHSDAFFWYVAAPSVLVFMLAVSGQIMWRAIKNRIARLHIQRSRNARSKKRGVARKRQ